RTRTAEVADEHHHIRPGTDALLLAAIASTLFEESLVRPGRLSEHLHGLDALAALLAPFTAETVAAHCRIEAAASRRPAPERAASPRRSTPPARARCALWSRSPATRCCRRRTGPG